MEACYDDDEGSDALDYTGQVCVRRISCNKIESFMIFYKLKERVGTLKRRISMYGHKEGKGTLEVIARLKKKHDVHSHKGGHLSTLMLNDPHTLECEGFDKFSAEDFTERRVWVEARIRDISINCNPSEQTADSNCSAMAWETRDALTELLQTPQEPRDLAWYQKSVNGHWYHSEIYSTERAKLSLQRGALCSKTHCSRSQCGGTKFALRNGQTAMQHYNWGKHTYPGNKLLSHTRFESGLFHDCLSLVPFDVCDDKQRLIFTPPSDKGHFWHPPFCFPYTPFDSQEDNEDAEVQLDDESADSGRRVSIEPPGEIAQSTSQSPTHKKMKLVTT